MPKDEVNGGFVLTILVYSPGQSWYTECWILQLLGQFTGVVQQ